MVHAVRLPVSLDARARNGNEADLFEEELRPLLPEALRLAAAMRLDREQAEDAVQEAALRAWHRRRNRRAGTQLRPWFLGIVANRCREARRGRWATVVRTAVSPLQPDAVPAPDTGDFLDLRAVLRRLPHRVRLAVALRYYLDLPYEDVAAVSGCSVNAAKARVRRGLAALQAQLGATEARR